jgi:hypothetical protein
VNTSEILAKAADLIEERGHWKGWYCGPNGELCARGAMYIAVGVVPPMDPEGVWQGYPEHGRVADATSRLDSHVGSLTERWNDATERTPAQVVTALRGAARAER